MTPVSVRHAEPRDADTLTAIEAEADTLFETVFGPLDWAPEPGAERLAADGFVLVAESDGRAVGFVHVLTVDGIAHLEQLSVRPAAARQGIGRQLVDAACMNAAALGAAEVTLRTFADVPWNAPFYAARGFEVVADDRTPWHASLVDTEHRLGLDALGARVLMARPL